MIEVRTTAKPGKCLRIMIVKAEPDIGLELKAVRDRQGYVVVDVVPTCLKAFDSKRQKLPEPIIADLPLGDGSSGLEAARQLLASFDMPAIYLTAFPERLLTGEEPEPAFVVQKPHSLALIATIVRQAAMSIRKAPVAA